MAATLIAGIAAAASAYGAAAAAGTAFSIFGLGATASFVVYALGSTALGLALNALAPKPKLRGANRGYQVNSKGAALDHQIIYGKMKTGGAIIYDEATGTNNKHLHRIIAVAGHEVYSFEEYYIDDELVTVNSDGNVTSPAKYVKTTTVTVQTGEDSEGRPTYGTQTTTDYLVRILPYTGNANQPAAFDLVEESDGKWTSEHRLRGIAYMYVRLKFNADVFPNGVPSITAVVKGKKVYNPANGTTDWSDNPALCLRDYLTSSYGLNEAAANIDDSLVASAASVCNQTNTLAGTARYTCNGAFTTALTPYDLLADLLTCMGGSLWYAQGKWRMKPAYWTNPVMDLTDDDLRSGINLSTRHSRRNNFNVVKGTFRGEESNWQVTDYPQVTSSVFVDADGGQESVADVDLPFTDNSIEARRIALITLESNRQQLTINATFGLRTLELQVGDNVRITNSRFGWENKEFQVIAWNFGLSDGLDLQTTMTLRETSEIVFDEVNDGIIYERDNTSLLSPFDVPTVGIEVSAEAKVSNQKVSNIAVATVTSGRTEAIDYVEVEYKLSSEPFFSAFGQGPLGEFKVRDLEVDFYDFRARAINTFGIKGQFELLEDQEINAFIGDPSDVSNLQAEISGGTLFLTWPPIPDPDLSHYEIKHNSNTSGANWGNSSTIIEKVARPSTAASVPARSGTFLIRAYDKEGNFSENVTFVIITPDQIPALGQTDTVTEDPSFTGAKTNVIKVGNNIEISDTTASSPVGEYFFNSYVDTGSARNARITGSRTFTRKFDGGTLLWDDIPQNWDTWPSTFDSWTDETAQFGDVSIIVYASATNDNPAGSPTWGAYELANGGFITGRAFRFKAILSSTNTKFTPSVSALSVDVEY